MELHQLPEDCRSTMTTTQVHPATSVGVLKCEDAGSPQIVVSE
jgi:hypothetical protein